MQIGNIILKNKLILAPMSGVTDVAFRRLCVEYGASLVCTEFVNVEGISRGNLTTRTIVTPEERPVSMQIFGNNISAIATAAVYASTHADILDFNIGCPAYCVVRQGAGAALLDNPTMVDEIAKTLVTHSTIPVTAKIRIGITDKHITAVTLAQRLEAAGISAITVHGRTMKQGYSGKARLDVIQDVKNAVKIPVIGNGDVRDETTLKRMLEVADAAMIGRAAIGDPQIFERLRTGKGQIVNDRIADFKRYVTYCEQYGIMNYPRLLRQALYFTTGFPHGATLRWKIAQQKTIEEIFKTINEYHASCGFLQIEYH